MLGPVIRLLNRIVKLALGVLLVLLSLALAWTAWQLATLSRAGGETQGTFEARRASYAQTATAISAGDETASLRAGPRDVLMQQNETDHEPAATPPGPRPTPLPRRPRPMTSTCQNYWCRSNRMRASGSPARSYRRACRPSSASTA